jgi:hypothetical protein
LWGEQQAPGLASWLADQLKAYQAQTGVNVTATPKEAQSVKRFAELSESSRQDRTSPRSQFHIMFFISN